LFVAGVVEEVGELEGEVAVDGDAGEHGHGFEATGVGEWVASVLNRLLFAVVVRFALAAEQLDIALRGAVGAPPQPVGVGADPPATARALRRLVEPALVSYLPHGLTIGMAGGSASLSWTSA
jgi:hypothetical protein